MRKWKKTKEDSVAVEVSQIDEKVATEESLEKQEASLDVALSEMAEKISDEIEDEVKEEELTSEIVEEAEEEVNIEETSVEETATQEVSVEEAIEEEVSVEEAIEEEVSVEEALAEEMPAEETPTEEASSEETPVEEKKGIKINKKALLIAIGAIVAAILAVYLGMSIYYSERFLMNTTVNGMDCNGKTVKQVENMMQTSVEEYVLTLEERHGITEEIKGTDIGIKYNGVDIIKEAMNEQNSFLWVKALFQKNNIVANIDFEYGEKKLDDVISKLECLKEEKQVSPISAIPVYQDGAFGIEEEVYGTLIDQEQLYKAVHQSVEAMDGTLDLVEKNCYIAPTYTKDSPEVIDARDALNTCLEAEITYSLDGIEVKVDKSKIENWISVDENLTVTVDEAQVRAFTDTLGSYYNTPNTAMDLTTPTGKVVNIQNARLGRVVGSAAECAELIEEIKRGDVVTREPLLSQGATPGGEPVWGTTYIEVDISVQHMWYIVDGAVAFESDVITGSPGRDTPAGVFTILEKMRNKTLVGNIVPSTGQPEYRTPVSYWMRVTWSGVGFHDATWQPAFGGQLYRQGYGSHGCINMPFNNVAALYNMVNVGCPVVIHY